jgi:diadenylate cyclase
LLKRLVQLYESIGTRDLVQILILAVVIHAVWRFLAKTCGSGSSLGRGLSVVVVGLFLLAQLIVASLDLTELSTILDYMLTASLVGLLVIFQPELRRGLMMLGQSGLWRYFSPPARPMADHLAEAAIALSQEGVGALIAVQRDVSLASYCETGERLDAEASEALLRTLFSPRSPLHDGAVVLIGSRVAAAACQLPLRVRDQEPHEYAGFHLGMRHRAALSLSEETDAVLLVVSEETGRISLALAGILQPVPRESLADRLSEVLSGGVSVPERKAA